MSIINDTSISLSFPKRLKAARRLWNKKMEVPLRNRKMLLDRWAASFFEDWQTVKGQSMSYVDRGVSIMVPYLVMSNPAASVRTKFAEHRAWAYTTALAMDHWIDEVRLAKNTLRPAAFNSMFGAGIVYTGLMKEYEIEIKGHLHDVGQPYADVIDDCDFVLDPSARTHENAEFMGHNYLIPTDYAKDFFGPKHADYIRPSHKMYDKTFRPEANTLTMGGSGDYRHLREYTLVTNYWVPDENIILTLLADEGYNRILNEFEHDGPEGGPYDILGYKWMPNVPIPIPPTWGWCEFDTVINTILGKLKKQAESQKAVFAYESPAADDADRIVNAGDRQAVKVDNIDRMKLVDFPGVNPDMYNWLGYWEEQFSRQGSNLYTLGGQSAQAGTLGQEQMMMANASRTVDDMINSVYDFTKSIFRKVAWYLWTDPLIQIPVIKRLQGIGDIQVEFSQADKEGDFFDFTFDIQPYSMQRMNPDSEFQRLMMFLSQWVLPTAQMAAAQGAVIDIPEVTKDLALKANIRDIDHWHKTALPQNAGMNPYSPEKGTIKTSKGVADGRLGKTGSLGAASRNVNQIQEQSRTGGGASKVT